MKIIGIIVEYNPFHFGHINHIKEIKNKYPSSLIVAVMSGNVVQRGEFAITSKWDRTKIALNNGIDILVQLPAFYSLNSAELFAFGAIKVLNEFKVDEIIFGSESNNLVELKKNAKKLSSVSSQEEIKILVKKYHSYPVAVEKYLKTKYKSNDILGMSYIVQGQNINKEIKFDSIKRDNNTKNIGASKIRDMIKNKENYKSHSPLEINKIYLLEEYFDSIITKLIGEKNKDAFLNMIFKKYNNEKPENLIDLINISTNKTFTKARVSRELLKWFLGIEEYEQKKYRVLGLNKVGSKYLKENKDINYTTNLEKEQINELKISSILNLKYSGTFEDEKGKIIINPKN